MARKCIFVWLKKSVYLKLLMNKIPFQALTISLHQMTESEKTNL